MENRTLATRPFRLPDGTQLAYVDQGSGPTILLLHGWSSSLNWFYPQVPLLSQRYRVLALDFRGHGASDKTPAGHTMEQYARDVHAFVEGVAPEPCLMVGWSMGSLVLWNYVLQFGRGQARGMVFVGQSQRLANSGLRRRHRHTGGVPQRHGPLANRP